MSAEERVRNRYAFWTEDPYFSETTKQELLNIQDPLEINDRFYKELDFGTGGMRGKLGAGDNRMNIYVIRKLTQGLADAIKEAGPEAARRGVVIACDSRRFSPEFALEAALVLGSNGIKVYLFEALRPTPELSYAVRKLGTIAGIMVTASHNPKEYNGYKVYWEDGGQLAPEKADQIVAKIREREDWRISVRSEEDLRREGLLVTIGGEIDDSYVAEVKAQLLNKGLAAAQGDQIKIVFTPLHGAGRQLVQRVLQEIGFSEVFTVPEQEWPDGEFPTVKVPNPEDVAAFQLAISYGQERDADLLIATDPDADRMGIACRRLDGLYRKFTGNQTGVLLEYYLLDRRREMGALPEDGQVIKSIVSTALAEKVAEAFGVELVNVPVGFKYIGEKIKEMEETGRGTYLWGFEESLGYLTGTYARDKDAVEAAALAAEAALYYKVTQGRCLDEVLEDIYRRWGYFLDDQVAFAFQGFDGQEKIEAIMAALRLDDRENLGGLDVVSREDFASGESCGKDGVTQLDFPRVDLLRYSLAGGGFVMARPSGTEPKIRFYFCIAGESRTQAEENLARVKEAFFAPYQSLLS